MFDDILTNENRSDITWNRNCGNCQHGSHILSKFSDKVLCQKKEKHVEKLYYCKDWYGQYTVCMGI